MTNTLCLRYTFFIQSEKKVLEPYESAALLEARSHRQEQLLSYRGIGYVIPFYHPEYR
ncbi:MAG: hypothetical protein RIM23_25865 [Coleofasciculus sp. G3-WIS-01]